MVMQRLMEISCRDSVLVWGAGGPGGVDRGGCGDTKALSPVLPNKQHNVSKSKYSGGFLLEQNKFNAT